TTCPRDASSDVCSSELRPAPRSPRPRRAADRAEAPGPSRASASAHELAELRDHPERLVTGRDALDVVEGVAEAALPVVPRRPRRSEERRVGNGCIYRDA